MSSAVTTKLFFMVALFIATKDVHAHQSPVKRSLMLEAWEQELHFAAKITIPGRLRPGMSLQATAPEMLKTVLARRALSGIEFHLSDTKTDLTKHETKLYIDPQPKGPVVVMLHGRLKLPRGETKLRVKLHPQAESITLKVMPGTRAPLKPSRGKVNKDTLVVKLLKGEEINWLHERHKQ